jgi:hypothetical protein
VIPSASLTKLFFKFSYQGGISCIKSFSFVFASISWGGYIRHAIAPEGTGVSLYDADLGNFEISGCLIPLTCSIVSM